MHRYVCSRIFLYNPPGHGNALSMSPDAPEELHRIEAELAEEDPKVNPWVCLALLIVTVAIMAVTAEFV
jgi:Ca2+:H+ antiporter